MASPYPPISAVAVTLYTVAMDIHGLGTLGPGIGSHVNLQACRISEVMTFVFP